jgi:hypothetical protein
VTLTDRPTSGSTVERPNPRRGASIPQIVGGAVLVLIGLTWLLERTGAIDISVTAVLALATMLVGISLILLARDGAHPGLVVLGTVLALLALLTAAAPFEGFQGGVGDRVIEISSVDEIRPDYNLAMGKLTIDLTEIDDLDASTRLTASVGMGELIVRVPPGAEVSVDGRVGAGQIEIMGRVTDGVGIDETFETPGFDQADASLSLDLQAFTGRVEVTDD